MGDCSFDLGVWEKNFSGSPSAAEAFQQVFTLMDNGDDRSEEVWDYLE